MVTGINVTELAQKLKSQEQFILLDVREPSELEQARITDRRLKVCALSQPVCEGIAALPENAQSKDGAIYILCHQGDRSAQVTGWLSSQGWSNAFSVAGGLNEYARKIDRSVGIY
jgi:rhodanese-related sulfurtransferase